MKKCTRCNMIKPLTDFYVRKNGVVNSQCKSCWAISCKEYTNKHWGSVYQGMKKWGNENKDKVKAAKKRWIDKNPNYHKEYRDLYYKEHPDYNANHYWKDPEKHREDSKQFRKNNPKHIQVYIKKKLKTDINFRIAYNMRHRIIYAVKRSKTTKATKTTKLLGCSISELKSYLESKFLPTMTWENYGSLWQVDHKIPCSSFDLTKEEEQRKCFHYTNLQPLFKFTTVINGIEYIGNINKGNKVIEDYLKERKIL